MVCLPCSPTGHEPLLYCCEVQNAALSHVFTDLQCERQDVGVKWGDTAIWEGPAALTARQPGMLEPLSEEPAREVLQQDTLGAIQLDRGGGDGEVGVPAVSNMHEITGVSLQDTR
jgi:hypothetical protein